MKLAVCIALIASGASMLFNAIQINYSNFFSDENKVALISVLASACAFLLLLILRISRRIARKKA